MQTNLWCPALFNCSFMKDLCYEKLSTNFQVNSFIFMDALAEMLPLPPKLQISPKRRKSQKTRLKCSVVKFLSMIEMQNCTTLSKIVKDACIEQFIGFYNDFLWWKKAFLAFGWHIKCFNDQLYSSMFAISVSCLKTECFNTSCVFLAWLIREYGHSMTNTTPTP